ncbi:tumor necrosis factor ligand superfamily member 10-like [Erythrolamprus reginae]|uniref:tumor necrosis factor ligand superfamily member 10-like n=1 Tax=Erythrolamprus reginae TaxID=121349 RepID=UPI00396CD125
MAPWRGAEAAPAAAQQYFRSDSSDSAAYMLGSPSGSEAEAPGRLEKRRRRKRCRPVWLAVAAMGIVALQIASATGLFVYFTMAIAKLKAQTQGSSEELRCLQLLNRMQELSELPELMSSQPCFKLALGIQDYVATITEDVVRRSAPGVRASQKQGDASWQLGSRPLAHLTLRRPSSSRPGGLGSEFRDLQQSCQHPIRHWASRTMHAHLQNLTYQDGQLQVSQAGKYYVYAQIYFRYPTEGADARFLGHQLVQCLNLQSVRGQTMLLLKGVGTKCWQQDAAYGLHALYQGGLFDLKAGDKLFVSVSSLDVNYDDEAGSYFGAFRLDV